MSSRIKGSFDPVIMIILVVIAAAVLLTYTVGAGRFAREGAVVVPGSSRPCPKPAAWRRFSPHIAAPKPDAKTASAASLVAAFAAIPAGLVKNADLVVLVLLVGGMFGVLRKTGAIDAGVDRLIHVTGGNKNVLIPVLMLVLGLGSTFLGFISEYLVVIPIVALVGDRLGYDRMFAAAIVGIAAKIGYATSVTNPLALVVAQPLAHVPLFSGMGFRWPCSSSSSFWASPMPLCASARSARPPPQPRHRPSPVARHLSVLLCLWRRAS